MYPLEIYFPKSRSISHGTAVEIARMSPEYHITTDEPDHPVHCAKFDLNVHEQANYALQLVQLIWGLKGILIRVGPKIAPTTFGNYLWLVEILNCYIKSMRCNDYKAFCWEIKTEWIPREIKNINPQEISFILKNGFTKNQEIKFLLEKGFIFEDGKIKQSVEFCYPCCHTLFKRHKIDFLHPSTLHDQLLALAVKENLDWCPNLDIDGALRETHKINKGIIDIIDRKVIAR